MTVSKGKKPSILMIHAFKANDTHLEAQRSSCSDLDSEVTVRSGSATDGSFDVGLGKTLRIGDFPSLDQSAHVYLYWPSGPFLATHVPSRCTLDLLSSVFIISARS